MTSPKRTPLYECHKKLGARLVEFAGYDMPVRYTSDKGEHMAVRQGCGIFDVSHMGEVFLRGPRAVDAADRLFSNDIRRIDIGQAMYTGLLNVRGGFVDDCIVYRFDDDGDRQELLVCVNASNRQKDFEHIRAVCVAEFAADCVATDESDAWAQIAVQGPDAIDVVAQLVGDDVRSIDFFHFGLRSFELPFEANLAGESSTTIDGAIIARTGYTGEDGFELYVPADAGAAMWTALCDVQLDQPDGQQPEGEASVTPCGLGARDTLRLEAGLSLYGNDIDDDTSPLEAGLNFIVKLKDRNKNPRNFIGADALRAQKDAGLKRKLCGLTMTERGIPRAGYPVLDKDGQEIGHVTSGTQGPYVDKAIAIALVDAAHATADTLVSVSIRNKPVAATVQKLPFYRRASK